MNNKNTINNNYGKWTVINGLQKIKNVNYCLCKCECGTIQNVRFTYLKNNRSTQCKKCAIKILQNHPKCKKFIDLTNKTFGKWTVLSVYKKTTCNTLWLCKCSCNNTSNVSSTDLRSGKSNKCKKCSAKEKKQLQFIDLTNKIFGNWTIIKRIGTTKYRRPIWLCLCKCGKYGKIPSSNLLNGRSLKCGKCNHYKNIKSNVWSNIINGAKARNININITIEYAWKIWEKQNGECALSGIKLYFGDSCNDETTASLDRIDPDKGYVEDNIQWIHKDINRAKWVFKNDEFIRICHLVSNKCPVVNDIIKDKYLMSYNIFNKKSGC